MTNSSHDDTAEARKRAAHIDQIIAERSRARPPWWMLAAAIIMVTACVADIGAFSLHAFYIHDSPRMDVDLAVHLAAFAVLCLLSVYLLVETGRMWLQRRAVAEQDQIDAYRYEQAVCGLREELSQVSETLRQAKVGKLIEDLAYGDDVVPFGRRRSSN